MFSKKRISDIVFSVYILISFYVLGGGIVNSLVAYRTWRYVGEKEFAKFHQVDTSLIIPFFVIFFLLSFVPQILLLWFRPGIVSKWLVYLALLFNLITLISTLAIQMPIQAKLDQGLSPELIDKLISTDLVYRRIPMILLAIVNFVMLFKVVKHSTNSTVPYN